MTGPATRTSSAEREAALLRELERLEPVDERELRSLGELRRELAALDRPFDEHAAATHLTASAVVVGSQGVLLHRHKKLGLWLQPGGHVAADEEPWQAALREVEEETGLVAVPWDAARPERLLHVDVHQAGPHRHLDLRYLLRAEGAPSPPAGESQLVRWCTWQEAFELADAGLIGALVAARSALGLAD